MDSESSNEQQKSRQENPESNHVGDREALNDMTADATTYVSNPFQVLIDSFRRLFTVNLITLIALAGVWVATFLVLVAAVFVMFTYTGIAVQNEQLVGFGDIAPGVLAAAGVILAVFLVWLVVLQTSWEKYAIETAQERTVSFDQIMRAGFRKAPGFFLISLLIGLLVTVGLVLFIVPGLLFLYWFVFAPFVYVDTDRGVLSSMKESKRLVRGKLLELIGLGVATFVLAAPAALPFIGPVYNLIFAPVSQLAFSYRYTSAKMLDRTGQTKPATDVANTVLMWVAVGAVILTLLLLGALFVLPFLLV